MYITIYKHPTQTAFIGVPHGTAAICPGLGWIIGAPNDKGAPKYHLGDLRGWALPFTAEPNRSANIRYICT